MFSFDWTNNLRHIRRWSNMMTRCYDHSHAAYHHYGGRGIKVCDDWHDPYKFVAQLPEGYFDRAQLDRIDNDGNYEPNNVRWSTARENHNNRRSCIPIEYKGRTQTLSQWADEVGLTRATLDFRMRKLFWSIEKTLETPPLDAHERMARARYIRLKDHMPKERLYVDKDGDLKIHRLRDQRKTARRHHIVEYQGEMLTIAQLSARCGITPKLLSKRIFERNWSVENAVAPKKR